MLQPVIARHDSSLVTLSSSDAVTVDGKYGNGKFTCQLRNANRGGTHAIKVVPNLVMVPNLFNNVYGSENDFYMNTFEGGPVGGITQWSIPWGFYTRDQFVSKFNSSYWKNPTIQMSVSDIGKIQLQSMTSAYYVDLKADMANMLGFTAVTTQVTVSPPNQYGWAVRVSVLAGGMVTANAIPSMGTTPLVYVVARQVALNHMVASDSKEYNVIATVSLHDVPYGSYGVFRGKDLFIEDVEFRNPRALDQIDVELLDYKYQPLVVDKRYPVILQLKVFHTDTIK